MSTKLNKSFLNGSSSKSKQTVENEDENNEINLLNYNEFCGENNSEKKLYLLQLPKELLKVKNLKLNFNNLTNGSIIEINNNQYAVNRIKSKVDFNCLIATDSEQNEFTAVNNFKAIIQLKRHIEMEPIKRPIKEENKLVEEPAFVEKYLKNRRKQLKRKHKTITIDSILNSADPELTVKDESTINNEDDVPVKPDNESFNSDKEV